MCVRPTLGVPRRASVAPSLLQLVEASSSSLRPVLPSPRPPPRPAPLGCLQPLPTSVAEQTRPTSKLGLLHPSPGFFFSLSRPLPCGLPCSEPSSASSPLELCARRQRGSRGQGHSPRMSCAPDTLPLVVVLMAECR